MRKWRIINKNGKYIPQYRWIFFWQDIYLPIKVYCDLIDKGLYFSCINAGYSPRFETLENAQQCAKMYDEYYNEDTDKVVEYYLNDKYKIVDKYVDKR